MSSLPLAVVAGVASAVAYGVSTAVQHDVAHETAGTAADGGHVNRQASSRGLLRLLRQPRWWASIAGDTLGLVLQLVALTFGPVVLVQPLFVLCLPVALALRTRLGGPPPNRAEYGACVLLGAGLAGFFLIVGDPGEGIVLGTTAALVTGSLALGLGTVLWIAGRFVTAVWRAVGLSAVAGAWFGVEAVLFNAASRVFDRDGWHAVTHAALLVPLLGAAVLGLLGFVLTQVAFQLGALGASFPAMLIADPVVAVVLGAAVLAQRLPLGALPVLGYVVCLAAVAVATIRLAAPVAGAGAGAGAGADAGQT